MEGANIKRISIGLLVVILLLMSGCYGEKPVLAPLKDGKGKLRVVYDDEDLFFNDYGDYFQFLYPDIEIEVVSTTNLFTIQNNVMDRSDQKMEQFIKENKPDVLFLNEELFDNFLHTGQLYSLDEIMKQEQYDLSGFMPGVIESLRDKGGGKLYGLAPFFSTFVLYYNEDLFKANHVDLPKDKMTWPEVLQLAARFGQPASEGRTGQYGLSFGFTNAHLLFGEIAKASSLQLTDPTGSKLQIHSDSWKQVMTMTVDMIRSGAVFADQASQALKISGEEAFLQDKSAMLLTGISGANEMERRQINTNMKKMNWGMVTAPINPNYPEESAYAHLEEICAIPADSVNKRTAWEFIKFMNSKELTKSAPDMRPPKLPTRMQYMKKWNGRSTEPLYALKLNSHHRFIWDNQRVPMELNSALTPLLRDGLQAVLANGKSIDELLDELQVKGQEALDKMKK